MPPQENVPLIKLEENARAPILRYDVPEPTVYAGVNLIRLEFDGLNQIFKKKLFEPPEETETEMLSKQPPEAIKSTIINFLAVGLTANNAIGPSGVISVPEPVPLPDPDPDPTPPLPGAAISSAALDDIVMKVKNGERVIVDENVNGDKNVTTVDVPSVPEPGIYLIETLKLTSFLGDYGAGRVIKTFSLLPGEVSKISIKSFRQRESTYKKSSSILDSVTTESADDFQKSLQQEQSDQKKFQQSKEYYADISAKASWGWGSAKAKAGIKGSSNASREEAVKNISNATENHSLKASAKREVQVNTNSEITEKEGEESSIERQIENINLSRTLNFVFRQMNQEFVTFIHLVDIRVAYFDGRRESRIEVPLSSLDQLLADVVMPSKQTEVKDVILEQVKAIRDHSGNLINPIKTVTLDHNDDFIQFDGSLRSEFFDAEAQKTYKLPGVLLKVDKFVMRTEGVIVESLLGEGAALDEYAMQLQNLEIEKKKIDVRMQNARASQKELLNTLVSSGDKEKAMLLAGLLCPCSKGVEEDDDGA